MDRGPIGAVVSKPACVTNPMNWLVISPMAASCTGCHDSPAAIVPFLERLRPIVGKPPDDPWVIDLRSCQYLGPDAAAILFSLLGDVLLMLPLERLFFFGLVAFLLAHLGLFLLWQPIWRGALPTVQVEKKGPAPEALTPVIYVPRTDAGRGPGP